MAKWPIETNGRRRRAAAMAPPRAVDVYEAARRAACGLPRMPSKVAQHIIKLGASDMVLQQAKYISSIRGVLHQLKGLRPPVRRVPRVDRPG
eukprot:744998-Pyramimonas_sp.AAC.1